MKDYDGLILFTFGALVAGFLFYGVVVSVSKAFKKPRQQNKINSSQMIDEQKRQTAEIRERQERLMQDQKRRIRDLQELNRR